MIAAELDCNRSFENLIAEVNFDDRRTKETVISNKSATQNITIPGMTRQGREPELHVLRIREHTFHCNLSKPMPILLEKSGPKPQPSSAESETSNIERC
jgi:hypothetical protein